MDFEILLGEIGESVGHFGPTYANSQFLVLLTHKTAISLLTVRADFA